MVELKTSIIAVTVYPDRARVIRQTEIELDAGTHRLQIGELPAAIDVDSVRARVHGQARGVLLGLEVRQIFYQETPAEKVRQLEAQVEYLQDELLLLERKSAILDSEREALNALGHQSEIFARGLSLGRMTAEDQMTIFDSLRARTESIDQSQNENAAKQRETKRALLKAQQELKQLAAGRQRRRRQASVDVEIGSGGALTLELSYVLAGAGWQPLYDLRLETHADGPRLEIGYLAQVQQNTGEDWTDVALALSTARPALSGALPELDPWYLSPVVPLARDKLIRSRMAPEMPAAAAPMGSAAPKPQAEPAPEAEAFEMYSAQVEQAGASLTYHIAGKSDIPSDGEPHKVRVAQFPLKPELDYVTSPKLVEAVYRRAQVVNSAEFVLLPGQASVFDEEAFIGKTQLELTAPGGELELFLGVDDRVRVERKLVRREVDKRLIAQRRRIQYGYEIELENQLKQPIELTLYDQYPVGRHEEIKVKLERVDPKPDKDSELNLLEWKLTLEASEKKTLRFDFSVDFPQEMAVNGLP